MCVLLLSLVSVFFLRAMSALQRCSLVHDSLRDIESQLLMLSRQPMVGLHIGQDVIFLVPQVVEVLEQTSLIIVLIVIVRDSYLVSVIVLLNLLNVIFIVIVLREYTVRFCHALILMLIHYFLDLWAQYLTVHLACLISDNDIVYALLLDAAEVYQLAHELQ